MEEHLIQEFKNGNKQAGNDFYNINIGLINFAIGMHKYTSIEAEEIRALVNQAFAYTMLHFDASKSKFSTYFLINVRGHIYNHSRDYAQMVRVKRTDFELKKLITCLSLDQPICKSGEKDIFLSDNFGYVDDCSQIYVDEILSKLNEKDKFIYDMYYENDYSQIEIGKIINSNQADVSRKICRMKKKLEIIIKEVC